MTKLLLSLALAVCCCATLVLGLPRPQSVRPIGARPPTKPTTQYNSTEPLTLLGPDLRFTIEQIRSGIIGNNYRWWDGLYVQIDSRFSQAEYDVINNGLYELYINLCVGIWIYPSDSNPSGDFVFIERGGGDSGCWSYVGKIGGRQVLNLQTPGCVSKGTVIHEAIHALGFFHEQSRPDRDDFVRIIWENIVPEFAYAFDRRNWDEVSTFDVPYDYTSIMHYNSRDFSSNGGETIVSWNGSPVGSRGVMTGSDIQKVRRMYNC